MTVYVRSKGTPIFRLIYEDLKDEITRGGYAPGARLPSESEPCRTYGVQRDTARRALKKLVDDGLIEKRPGVGSFVMLKGDRVTVTIDRARLNDPVIAHLLLANGAITSTTEKRTD